MAASPPLKIHNPSGEYVASCKYYEDAAMLVGNYGVGAKVKHSIGVIWHEGSEEISAAESWDSAGTIMRDRVYAKQRAGLVKSYGEEKVAQWERDKERIAS
jgi:hypothetical protein